MPNEQSYDDFIEAAQPCPQLRVVVRETLLSYCKKENINLAALPYENQIATIAAFMRIGLPVSKDTVYPIVRGRVVMIQDNYLFLQKLILDYSGAKNLIVDIIFNDEFIYVEDLLITRHFNKNEHIPLASQSTNTTFKNVHSIIIGLSGGDIQENTFKVYRKEQLINRVGTALFTNREWNFNGRTSASDHVSTKERIDKGHKDHKQIEMLKKTAIRAFAKERYGSALELIRTIDIEQSEISKKQEKL